VLFINCVILKSELLSLWCLTPFSTIFLLFRGCQFDWWKKPRDQEDITNLQ